MLEGFRRFDLVVRLKPEVRQNAQDFANLLVSAPNGQNIPLAQLAHIGTETGPVEIARENGQRRISVEVNVVGVISEASWNKRRRMWRGKCSDRLVISCNGVAYGRNWRAAATAC